MNEARSDVGVSTVALAVWVKTPGHAPAKTRLARAIGTAAAETFYRLAVEAVREVVEQAATAAPGLLAPYWAVAEEHADALAYWGDRPDAFSVVAQGAGGLGERLAHVYDALAASHGGVLFIGADAPQLAPALLVDAARGLRDTSAGAEFVLGPADDGGFYLFGGRRPIPRRVWTDVSYSVESTMAELRAGLAPYGGVRTLAPAFDVDTVAELRRLRDALAARRDLRAAQRELQTWLETKARAW